MSAATPWDRAIGIRSFAEVREASGAHTAPHALAILGTAHGAPLTVGDFKRDDSVNVALGYRLHPKSGSS